MSEHKYKAGDKVRVARGETGHWLGAIGEVQSYDSHSSVVRVMITKRLDKNGKDIVGQVAGFYEENLDLVPSGAVDDDTLRIAAEFLGVDVSKVLKVIALARYMTTVKEVSE